MKRKNVAEVPRSAVAEVGRKRIGETIDGTEARTEMILDVIVVETEAKARRSVETEAQRSVAKEASAETKMTVKGVLVLGPRTKRSAETKAVAKRSVVIEAGAWKSVGKEAEVRRSDETDPRA